MQADRWRSIAVPILEAVGRFEERDPHVIHDLGDLAAEAGLSVDAAFVAEVERLLNAGFIDGELTKLLSGGDMSVWHIYPLRLSERGARVVGVWPPDDPYEALIRIIEIRIAEEANPDERSRLRKLRDRVSSMGLEIGTGVVSGVLLEVAKAVIR